MTTIENIERVLRQLEALGDNLEHPSTETMIESKLPAWVLNKKIRQALDDSKIRRLPIGFVEVNQQVNLGRSSTTQIDNKLTRIEGVQKQNYKLDKTSALSTLQTNQKEPQTSTIRKKPCIFCIRDHWYSECDIYPTVNSRMKRLKSLKKCAICFKDSHERELCKAKKKCFYCKGLHHSALCDKRNTSSPNIITLPRKQELTQLSTDSPTFMYHTTSTEQQVVDIPNNEEFEDLISYKKQPDILIGADYFFKFIDLQDKRELHSGYTLVQSKVGPMIVGSGYIDKLRNSKSHLLSIICSVGANPNLDLENFWKLEMIGIQESPI
ncbi:unnamed protein product [Onchocerca flexuosa]|uniref:DUF1758 domain-containing protein n=1 Tax=Onchocerca flexuosa TaxID=387005 RepID=A0A183HGP0_9BILA|nr:unnamed protein product [Onchocerca flexuosa]